MAESSSSRLAASRMALVATASTCSTPWASRNEEKTAAVWIARSIGLGWSTPSSPIPALTRVASRISSASAHQLPGLVLEHHQPEGVRAHVDDGDAFHAADHAASRS